MWTSINHVSNRLFELWLWPIAGWPVWLQIALTAVPATVLVLLAYRYCSNQTAISRAKDQIKGHLFELWLYKDDPGVLLAAQWQVMLNSFRYLGHSLLPLLALIVPMLLVVAQVESRFGWQALPTEQAFIVAATPSATSPQRADADPRSLRSIELAADAGLTVETLPLHLADLGDVLWRVRATVPGVHELVFTTPTGVRVTHPIAVATKQSPTGERYQADDWQVLIFPTIDPLPTQSGLDSIRVDYPRAGGSLLGLSTASWLLFGFTMLFGFAFRGLFGVTF